MGNNLKAARAGVPGTARSRSSGRSHLRHQYLSRWLHKLSVTAHAEAQSETATFADGWLTKMIMALTAIGP
jgi:hypothetical protein